MSDKDQEYLDRLLEMFDDDRLPLQYINTEVSKATLIESDIVITIAKWIEKHWIDIPNENYCKIQQACKSYWEVTPPDPSILWEKIFDLMNEISPKGCYFGCHQGDGSLFGFFEVEEDPFELEEPFNERPII